MEKTINLLKPGSIAAFIGLAFLGSGLIALCSLVRIPFIPVPFTLQTLAIFLLGLTQSPKLALSSALCYLFWGSLGLPVFSGRSNPFWMAGPCGGYLIAFPLAAYLIAILKQRIHPFVAILCGQMLIYLIGFIWLIPFIGITSAFMKGVVFFIPSGLFKNVMAVIIANRWNKRRE